MGSQKIGSIVSTQACDTAGTIGLFPTRYTLRPRDVGEDGYAYTEASLERNFPALENSQYVVRHLRKGFVYLWDPKAKAMTIFEVTGNGFWQVEMVEPIGIKKYHQVGSELTTIPMIAKHTVYMCFTDTLLSNNKLVEVENIQNNAKTKLKMTKVIGPDLVSGKFENGCVESFKAASVIEDYKKKYATNYMSKYFDWSGADKPFPSVERSLANQMGTYQTSAVVALYDNIGMVTDQTRLIEIAREQLCEYVSKDNQENARRTFASNTINDLYHQNTGEFYSRLSKHINLDAKITFDQEYRRLTLKYQVLIRKRKRDRCELLKTYTKSDAATDLGSSFSFYDTKNPISSIAHAEAFCSCTRGMMFDPQIKKPILKSDYALNEIIETKEELESIHWKSNNTHTQRSIELKHNSGWLDTYVAKKMENNAIVSPAEALKNDYIDNSSSDPEKALFHTWWQKAAKDNPILCNLDYDSPKPKKDLGDLPSILLSEAEYKSFREFAAEDSKKRKATLIGASKELTEILWNRLGTSTATSELVQNIKIYGLSTHTVNKGLSKSSDLNKVVQKRLNIPTVANTEAFFKILKRRFGSDPEISKMRLTQTKILAKMSEAMGFSSTKVSISLQKIARDGGGEHIFYSVGKKTEWSLDKHPFGHKAATSVTALSSILMFINFSQAVDAFKKDDWGAETVTNFLSAVGGVLLNMCSISELANSIVASQATKQVSKSANWLLSFKKIGTKAIIGIVTAALDFLTNIIKAAKAAKVGDTDAAVFYAGAAICLGTGGVILSVVGGALGVIFGVALIIAGIWFLFEASKALDRPIEIWLDRCIFGEHKRSEPPYTSANQEFTAYMHALYAPVITSYDWKVIELNKPEVLNVDVMLPLKDKYFRMGQNRGSKIPTVDTTIIESEGPQFRQGRVTNDDDYKTKFQSVKEDNTGVKFQYHIFNISPIPQAVTPRTKELRKFTFAIKYIPRLSGYNEWLTLEFRITRGFFEGGASESIEYL